MDYFYSDEGVVFYHYGIEGETYVKNDDGSLSFTPEIMAQVSGDKSYDEVVSQVGPYCGGNNPTMMSWPGYAGAELTPIPIASAEAILPNVPDVIWPIFTYTDEELNIVNTVGSDINAYVKQTCAEFLTGERELNDEEWDAYVAQVKAMGLDQMLEVMESVIDRVEAITGVR